MTPDLRAALLVVLLCRAERLEAARRRVWARMLALRCGYPESHNYAHTPACRCAGCCEELHRFAADRRSIETLEGVPFRAPPKEK